MAGTVRAVAERYPNLVAQEGLSRLQKKLVETEQRIALARTYYNDIATQFATRVGQVPDTWLAGRRGIRPEPLLGLRTLSGPREGEPFGGRGDDGPEIHGEGPALSP